MNDILSPPAERDLPTGRAARIRAEVMAATRSRRGPARSVRRRAALGTAVAVVVAGIATTVSLVGHRDGGQVLLAMGPGELSPDLRAAAEQCLTWNAAHQQIPTTIDDLSVAAARGHDAIVLFLTATGYLTCSVSTPPGGEPSGGSSGEREWAQRAWLPGPVQRLLLTSSEHDGGDVAVSGRVSARVARLVLEHGDGHTTQARLAHGVFGLVTAGAHIRAGTAELVAYDASGAEIDRRSLFQPFDRSGCYADPSGAIVYGTAGPNCRPAERWAG